MLLFSPHRQAGLAYPDFAFSDPSPGLALVVRGPFVSPIRERRRLAPHSVTVSTTAALTALGLTIQFCVPLFAQPIDGFLRRRAAQL